MDRRLQPGDDADGRELRLRPEAQNAHDLPLPVRPHQRVQTGAADEPAQAGTGDGGRIAPGPAGLEFSR